MAKYGQLPQDELELRLIYSIIVAGKSARFTEGVMQRLGLASIVDTPFNLVRQWKGLGELESRLRAARSGNYKKIARALSELTDRAWDLTVCTPQQLETVHGIGPKTARFFLLWTRPGVEYAALDVHVLRWMRANGYPDAPKSTPSGAKYRRFELAFIAEAHKRNMTPGEFDAAIWEAGSQGKSYQDNAVTATTTPHGKAK